jgi:hypothetical protein
LCIHDFGSNNPAGGRRDDQAQEYGRSFHSKSPCGKY